ncbi:MAG: dephospho-CoA kinase [Bacteroidetes bacterium RIFOXYA12_FULL_35_11]|nr:MAG: dephospho-CoA kinase [Bacteroidetes bacterium GWF2_35_48]OFY76568.1 MAG: dephospho-CoA kinase [Bacteroidetes bacterium RIFOXYA12_FULL_35_11]OFZ01108.1 MAG: dephospho-CoA kinase [Bacteroidetes bacterium RIFOXYC12_FULL_35_7]
MFIVGITGGIGSGKSFVSAIFRHLGIPIFDADSEAKLLMSRNLTVKNKLIGVLGKDTILQDGSLNKKFIAAIIFNDKSKLQEVNNIVHPATLNAFKNWAQNQKSNYVLFESAILFESKSNEVTDVVITVTAPENIRIQRVIKRDGSIKQKVLQRMNQQWSENEKKGKADYIIINNEKKMLLPQILKIHTLINKKRSDNF